IFIALAEKSDEATISLLMRKSRKFEITVNVLAAAASNVFHGDEVLPFLLKSSTKSLGPWSPHQSTSILKAAVGNQELGVLMLETVLKLLPSGVSRIEDCIFTGAAGN